MFKTIAAAAARDQLRLEGIQLERDFATEQDVQILKRDNCRVGEVQPLKRRERRIKTARVTDASQVRLEINDWLGRFAFLRIRHD